MQDTLTAVPMAHHTQVRIARATSRFGVPSLRYLDGVFEIVGSEWSTMGCEFIYEVKRVGTSGHTDKVRGRYVFRLADVEGRRESARLSREYANARRADKAATIARLMGHV